jgi:hypothetical protein
MARKPNHGFEKRKREQQRAERAQNRRNRKMERSASGPSRPGIAGEDPDLVGIVVGPQPRDEVSAEEAKRVVERAMNPGSVGGGERAIRTTRLFVGNLDFDATEEDIRGVFSTAGFKVKEAPVVRDRNTGQSRGFAFVEVEGPKEATRAISELNGVELAGRGLRISLADKPGR